MKQCIKAPVWGLFVCMSVQLLLSCNGCSMGLFPDTEPENITLLSYNVQNLFDDVWDGSEYPEYDPAGDSWSSDLYHLKLLQLSDVLSRYPEGGADILLLQEVENLNALEMLVTHYLKGCGYRYYCISDAKDSAVNTAILSRYPLEDIQAHSVSIEGIPAGRPILECKIQTTGIPLRIFNCHWKSKSGGAAETEPLRRVSAAVLAGRIHQIAEQHGQSNIIAAGDFNECIDEQKQVDAEYPTALVPERDYRALSAAQRSGCIGVTGREKDAGIDSGALILVSPWLMEPLPQIGSYAYRSEWETIDHFLLSPALFDNSGMEFEQFEVIQSEQLLKEDGYPKRWIPQLESGYSDHLPLLLKCSLE
ncbi:MAG: endonuclease/exonuclease/phosphatase family protein [Spirochaetaceae bacterium]|nr:endonuclease/exonuclease/phosphatase family protein [Spirochaetaceae bacterium]MCF7947559.1 endonuclease/exonuclease/phosphatase family protein [Spirochaetia bacterium]MCF7950483.1 endonuclease/exonuclease/phosphatase family protein [Spirochaetaceae bacterium]